MNYHNKKFKAISTSENSSVSEEVVFHYKQQEHILSCEYSGGAIVKGQLLGVVKNDGSIKFHYHQINTDGELMTGRCKSTPELMPNGKLRLNEQWQWTSGDCSKGSSVLEEI